MDVVTKAQRYWGTVTRKIRITLCAGSIVAACLLAACNRGDSQTGKGGSQPSFQLSLSKRGAPVRPYAGALADHDGTR